ncbi:hypothetical protein HPG69_019115 [Diceros bicornis minor]|uniref:Uncharacterized protein n=1 Tax=Diceros bicornis minor TaxID=77932 RepID=A0A7J7FGM6_DICBM|nr:hypothetical protein HPG69_019115 [Diceros bicornis minor]
MEYSIEGVSGSMRHLIVEVGELPDGSGQRPGRLSKGAVGHVTGDFKKCRPTQDFISDGACASRSYLPRRCLVGGSRILFLLQSDIKTLLAQLVSPASKDRTNPVPSTLEVLRKLHTHRISLQRIYPLPLTRAGLRLQTSLPAAILHLTEPEYSSKKPNRYFMQTRTTFHPWFRKVLRVQIGSEDGQETKTLSPSIFPQPLLVPCQAREGERETGMGKNALLKDIANHSASLEVPLSMPTPALSVLIPEDRVLSPHNLSTRER